MDDSLNSSGGSSASSMLPLLTSLPLSWPSQLELLCRHRPYVQPSLLPASATKFVGRINNAIISRDNSGVEDKLAALSLARELVLQDTEGWVLAGWGKGWVGSTLGALSVSPYATHSLGPLAHTTSLAQ
jgi:hypothetical protein